MIKAEIDARMTYESEYVIDYLIEYSDMMETLNSLPSDMPIDVNSGRT